MNPYAINYVENLISDNSENSKKLYNAIRNLKKVDEKAMTYCASLIYSYNCGSDVAFLAFDISLKQIECGRNANPQRLFESLSKNERSDYAKVKEKYDATIKMLEKFSQKKIEQEKESVAENKKIEKIIEENTKSQQSENKKEGKRIEIINENKEFAENYLYMKKFKPETEDKFVINSSYIPKTGWLMDVYCLSYEDYCNLITNTLTKFNNEHCTVFLYKPNVIKEKFNKNKIPKIAYSVLMNENYSFKLLDKEMMNSLDDKNVDGMTGVKIAKRTYVKFVTFCDIYSDRNGNAVKTNDIIVSCYHTVNEVLNDIDEIGKNKNIAKYHIECMTGLSQTGKQLYKAVLCKTNDITKIAYIISNFSSGKLDFIIDSNDSNTKVLFVHISHLKEFIEKTKDKFELEYDVSFDNMKI